MRNKNVWILAALVLLIVLVALVAPKLTGTGVPGADAPTLATAAPTEAPSAEPTAAATEMTSAETTTAPTEAPSAETTATSAPTGVPTATEAPTTAPAATSAVAQSPAVPQAYLLVTVGGLTYQPLPLTVEDEYRLTQPNGAENIIHATPTSVEMKSSTCDNQDCVHQGVVTLDNMENRILGNMIICLPNQVTLELFTPEGIYGLFAQPTQEP